MILLASTSLWHWQQREDVTPRNLSVGYWQLAKTYVKAKKPESALAIAQRCLEKSLEAELSAFYLGYAYEVMAWANLLNNNTNKALQNLNTATNYLAKIKDEEEKQYLQADLLKLETKLAN